MTLINLSCVSRHNVSANHGGEMTAFQVDWRHILTPSLFGRLVAVRGKSNLETCTFNIRVINICRTKKFDGQQS